uniref:Uncharacterized protein n=1 Tax=Aplanochytrium stocchinoi TaxID=215587 RepID=A0A7S3PHT3_9STRA|mmetsp:Transcript_12075/g.15010  ORF Transcript_12075/g.15010 Transcript_12075/m.15010 type:complete len:370 (-) Transcript_12075:8-1117(-)
MSFLSGEITDSDTCYACYLRLNRCNLKGNWSLCVTGSPPSNRPCAGSCIYDTVYGSTGAFAWVEGYHMKHDAKRLDSQFWILDKSEIEASFQAYQFSRLSVTGDSANTPRYVQKSFVELYSRFFYPRHKDIILDKINVILDNNAQVAEKEEFVLYARELELYFHKNHLHEMQRSVASVGYVIHILNRKYEPVFESLILIEPIIDRNGLKAEFNAFAGSGSKSTISYDVLVIIVIKLFGHLRISNFDERKWLDILLDEVNLELVNKNLSFQMFCDAIHNIHTMLLNRFNLTEGLADKYQHSRTKLSKLGNRVPVASLQAGDILSVTVYRSKARFYFNGKFQIEMTPTCNMPWRFAWSTSSSSSATVLSPE